MKKLLFILACALLVACDNSDYSVTKPASVDLGIRYDRTNDVCYAAGEPRRQNSCRVLWCKMNYGATAPGETGGYYDWDEAVGLKMGGNWQLPTESMIAFLTNNKYFEWQWEDADKSGFGVAGYWVKSLIKGYSGNKIFLPAVGYKEDATLKNYDVNIYCWSQTLDAEGHPYYIYGYNKNYCRCIGVPRTAECPIRPVYLK